MPLTKTGQKVMGSMKDQYGEKKGESVFYASINAGKPGSGSWHGAGDSNHTAAAGKTAATKPTPGIHHVSGTKSGKGTNPGEAPVGKSKGGFWSKSGGKTSPVKTSAGAVPSAGGTKAAPGARTTPGIHHSQGTKVPLTPKSGTGRIGQYASEKGTTYGGPQSGGAPKKQTLGGGVPAGAPSRSKAAPAAFNDGGYRQVQGGGSPFGGETRQAIAGKYTRRVALSTGA